MGRSFKDEVKVEATGEETNPDVSVHGPQPDGLSTGLLCITADDAGGFGCGLRTADCDLAGSIAFAVFEHLGKLRLWNDAGFSIATQHLFNGNQCTVIDLVTEGDEQTASLADQMHWQHAVAFDQAQRQ